MSNLYFDASALVKYYVLEPGSTWIRRLIDDAASKNNAFVCEVSVVEVPAAFAILQRTSRLSRKGQDGVFRLFMRHLGDQYRVIQVTSPDFRVAAELTQRHPLRAYDALQLAVALRQQRLITRFGTSLTFISGDRTQLQAAEAEGLAVDDPFEHVLSGDTPAPVDA